MTIQESDRHRPAPGKRASAEEAEVQHKYGSLRVLRDGRVRFSARTFLGLPELDFSTQHGARLANGSHVWSQSDYSICANLPEKEAFLFLYLSRGRVDSACFNYGLTPDELRKAVAVLRKAGGGLERWIVPGLEYTRDSITRMVENPGFPREENKSGLRMLKVLQELLEATRDLPVAEPWKRTRREWEQWKQEQAGAKASTATQPKPRSRAPRSSARSRA